MGLDTIYRKKVIRNQKNKAYAKDVKKLEDKNLGPKPVPEWMQVQNKVLQKIRNHYIKVSKYLEIVKHQQIN